MAQTPSDYPQLAAWKRHHRHCAARSGAHLLAHPIQSLLTAMVMAIALLLPAALYVVLNNLERLGQSWDTRPKLSVYLKPQYDPQALETLKNSLTQRSPSFSWTYLSPSDALASLNRISGLTDALKGLDHNPLPATLVIQQSPTNSNPQSLLALADELEHHPLVDQLDKDMDWVQKLQKALQLGQKIVAGLAGLLGAGLLIVIGNTLRLDIENRREEIRVTKLLGATPAFIRRPFLYLGSYYGLLGGALACISLSLCLAYLRHASAPLAAAYQTDFMLQGLGFLGSLALIALSAGLGLVGAFIAVGRQLGHIEPK